MKKVIILIVLVAMLPTIAEGQTRTRLTPGEINALETLYDNNLIEPIYGGWLINPDVWRYYSFQERKNFTERLAIYSIYHAKGHNTKLVVFYNMATRRKIAQWYGRDYIEF